MNSIVVPSVPALKIKGKADLEACAQPERRQRKTKNDRGRAKREVFSTLLSSFGESVDDYSETFMNEGICFRDLASLKSTDLFLMGFKDEQQRSAMIELFQQLPRQDQTYESILKSHEAKTYNNLILSKASTHLEMMRSGLAAANYKLKIMPSEDVIIGDKSFASRFVLEAVEELKRVADELDFQLAELDETVSVCSKDQSYSNKKQKKSKLTKWLKIATAISIATILYWRTKKFP